MCEAGAYGTQAIRINHAIMGLAGEVGELSTQFLKWIYYGKPLDVVNLIEEGGDCLWFLAELFNALGADMSVVMEANIAKLRKRFPERWSIQQSAEENRDRNAEKSAIMEVSAVTEDTRLLTCPICKQLSYGGQVHTACVNGSAGS